MSARSSNGSPAPSAETLSAEMTRLAVASSILAAGYAVTARHARDASAATTYASLALRHRAIAVDVASVLALLGVRPPRITTTCGERLRWEWLASSARLIDGAAEGCLVAECARIQRDADAAAVALRRAGSAVPTTLRQVLADLPGG